MRYSISHQRHAPVVVVWLFAAMLVCGAVGGAMPTPQASRATAVPTPIRAPLTQAAGCVEEERYSENFETGWASNWYLGSGFRIVRSYCKTPIGIPDHVCKTKNGGASWEIVLKGEKRGTQAIEAIAVDPSNPRNVYVAYHSEQIWFSSDAGSTWRRADQGVIRHGAHLYLWAIAADSSGSTFYLNTCGQGILRNDVKAAETLVRTSR